MNRTPVPRPRARLALALAALAVAGLVVLAPGEAEATGGAYAQSAHGSRERGVQRLRGARRGACAHCHSRAGGVNAGPSRPGEVALFAPNDNALCLSCHQQPARSYLGVVPYAQSTHARDSAAAWPGPHPPARPTRDAGKCVNCHDPHARRDADGVIPAMLRVRGDRLCLGCHGGMAGATNLADGQRLPYRHPLTMAPAAPLAGAAPLTGGAPLPRDGCSACHNVHAAASDPAPPRAPAASARLLGVPRVRLSSGAPGSEPRTTAIPAGDRSPVLEHEVCFGCHAGALGTRVAATREARSVGAQVNPANASHHPILAPGRNRRIDRNAFVAGWSADRLVACSDCHSGSDGVRGPHASEYPGLLRKRSPTSALDRMVPTDLCFECHSFATYASPAGGLAHEYSRFSGHAAHVARGATCHACHEPHGSAAQPALIALRTPGLLGYAQELDGGSCTTTCHTATPTNVRYLSGYGR